jgi:hypothetical protein
MLPIPQSKEILQKRTSAGHAMEEKASFHMVATMQTFEYGEECGGSTTFKLNLLCLLNL